MPNIVQFQLLKCDSLVPKRFTLFSHKTKKSIKQAIWRGQLGHFLCSPSWLYVPFFWPGLPTRLMCRRVLRTYFANTKRQMYAYSGRLQLEPFNLQPLPIHLPLHPITHTHTSNITLNHCKSEQRETFSELCRQIKYTKSPASPVSNTPTSTYACCLQMHKGPTHTRLRV